MKKPYPTACPFCPFGGVWIDVEGQLSGLCWCEWLALKRWRERQEKS